MPPQSGSTIASGISFAPRRPGRWGCQAAAISRGWGSSAMARMLPDGGNRARAFIDATYDPATAADAQARPRGERPDVGVHGPGDPASRRRADPNLRTRAKAAWSLYDFANTIFSFAIVSGAIGPVADRRLAVRRRPPARRCCRSRSSSASASTRSCRRCWVRSSDRGGRRLPFLLAFTALCVAPTAVIGISGPDPRRAPVHRRELLVPGRAHLLRRVDQARVHAGDARPAVGHRDGDRVLRHGVRRAADLSCSTSRSRPLPARGAAVRAVRDPDLPWSSRSTREPPRASGSRRADVAESWAQLSTTIRHARERPGPAALPARHGSSTRMP